MDVGELKFEDEKYGFWWLEGGWQKRGALKNARPEKHKMLVNE